MSRRRQDRPALWLPCSPSGRLGPIAAAALALLAARPASATTVSFADFSNTTGLTLSGSALATSTNDGVVLRLVPAVAAKSGSAFSSATVRAADFSTSFSFRITNPGGVADAQGQQGADGFVFVVQPVSSSIGGAGSGLGYSGINPSLGVEFDIFFNGASDTSTNHLGIDLNGNVNSVVAVPVSPRWDDGNRWYAWVDYDGTTLEVRANQTGTRPIDPLLTRVVDIPTLIGQQDAYVGFTAGTGAAWAAHDIIDWIYFDSFNPGGTTTSTSTTTTSTSTSTSSTSTSTSSTTTSTSSTSTSTSSSTTTTSAPPATTTTSTTAPRPTTTTTTIPEGDACETEAIGPTFRSLDCRLAALLEATQAADDLGDLREKLIVTLGKARERENLAESWCTKGKTRQASVRLRQVTQQLAQYRQRLRGLPARKRIPEEIREPLAQAADRIRSDARSMRSALACPEDAIGL
jgi:Legume lectin domain